MMNSFTTYTIHVAGWDWGGTMEKDEKCLQMFGWKTCRCHL